MTLGGWRFLLERLLQWPHPASPTPQSPLRGWSPHVSGPTRSAPQGAAAWFGLSLSPVPAGRCGELPALGQAEALTGRLLCVPLGARSALGMSLGRVQRKPSPWDLPEAAAQECVSALSLFRDGRCRRDSQILGLVGTEPCFWLSSLLFLAFALGERPVSGAQHLSRMTSEDHGGPLPGSPCRSYSDGEGVFCCVTCHTFVTVFRTSWAAGVQFGTCLSMGADQGVGPSSVQSRGW